MDYMRYGVDVARRGWLAKDSVVNTLEKEKIMKTFMRYNKS
jgi:histidinol phosphatase-like PHP family hydrolase